MRELIALAVLAAAVLLGWRLRDRGRRRARARELADELLPEIRSTLAACDSGKTPLTSEVFDGVRPELPRALSAETLHALETFYGCVVDYSEAARAMTEAFGPESELSLGDRIRAKDRRDRCLKDVYYSGEAALERLGKV